MDDQSIRREFELIKEMFMSTPLDVYFKDRDGRYRYLNRVHEEVLGRCGQESPIGKTDFDLMPSQEVAARFWEEDQRVMESGKPSQSLVDLPDENGAMRKYTIMKNPVKDASGCVVGILVTAIDVTEDYANREIIRQSSIRDNLTGVLNRNAFDSARKALESRFAEADPAALWIDANNLKCTNDVWGHEVGDKLLKACAHELMEAFADKGEVFRVGGDEFVVLFERCDRTDILERAAQVQQRLKKQDDFVLPISISIGYADYTTSPNMMRLLQNADRAMYRDKVAKHEQQSLDMQAHLLRDMEAQGIADPHALEGLLDMNGRFCVHLGLSDEARAKIDQIITFSPIARYRYETGDTLIHQGQPESDLLDKGFKLLHAIFQSVSAATAVLYVYLNWDGTGNWDNLRGREIPFYSRIARIVMDAYYILKKRGTASETVERLCTMSGRELDPTLCSQMCDFLLEGAQPSNRSMLIRCLSQKYQTNIEGLQRMIEELPAYLFYKDLDGRYQLATETCSQAARSVGFEHESVIGKTDFEIFPDPDLARLYHENDVKVIATNTPSMMIVEETHPSGDKKTLLMTKTPVHDEKGAIVGVRGTIHELPNPLKPDFVYRVTDDGE